MNFSKWRKVRFDIESAQKWVVNYLEFVSQNEVYSAADIDKITTMLDDELELITSINDGYFNISVDKFGARLHSPLKRVSRRMRPFMIVDGYMNNELICLDISNSQVYFSTLLANPTIVSRIIPEFSSISELHCYSEKYDFEQFISTSTDGTIYGKWQEKQKYDSRDVAKKEFMENQLPFIIETFVDQNGDFETNCYHKNLSCAVQRLESGIFIKIICKSLLDRGIKPFFTVHDSIYFPAKFYEEAKSIIGEEFNLLGIPAPKMKTSKIEPILNGVEIF